MNNTFRHATAFISSTFADMKDERNLMTYNILPRIKKWAFDRGIIFDVVDLRWGINDEQANDLHHTIKLCLQNVRDTNPIFVCFLGERYGWIPPVEDFNQSMFAKSIDKYKNLSATELEIIEALDGAFFDSDQKSCLFLLRNSLDFNNIPTDVKNIFKDENNAALLQNLKDSICTRKDIVRHDYSAKLLHKNGAYSLEDFSSEHSPLEDIIFDDLKNILIEKYNISNERATVFDDVLTRQYYHQKELLLYPEIDKHQDAINEFLSTTVDYGYTPIGTPHNSAISSQIAHFVEKQSAIKNQRVICRFWGLNVQIDNINSLICSIAYEFSGDKNHLGDPIDSLLYLKTHLENSAQNTLLVIVGLPYNMLPDFFNVFIGLKWTKQLIFFDIDDIAQTDLYIDYDKNDFANLAKYMFEKKAKSLSKAQLQGVLQASSNDYPTLKIIVDYLCNFARYETIDNMIHSLALLDTKDIARLYLNSLVDVQNSHNPQGIMSGALELLCNSPLPLSKEDIVDAICLDHAISDRVMRAQIEKEVAFSLRFASELVDEYNSRFKINDELIKTLIMFDEDESMPEPYNYIPKESALILSLRRAYLNRLEDLDSAFSNHDAQNLLEIIKDYSDEYLKRELVENVFKNTSVFYKLTKALDKRHLVDFFKTLALQSLGYDVDSYFAKEINRILKNENNNAAYFEAITHEKIFSLSKTLHTDNIFIKYYLAMQKINTQDLSSKENFAKSLKRYLSSQDIGCHKSALPHALNISKNNTCAYTVFDPTGKEYSNFVCFCQDGFLIICDVYTGEMTAAYAIARGFGEIVSVFYQNHTIHIVYEKGVLCYIDLWSKRMNVARILPDIYTINTFENYYSVGRQVAVADNRRIVIFNAARVVNDLAFGVNYKIICAYAIHSGGEEMSKVCAIAKDEYGLTYVYSIDMQQHKIIDQYVFIEKDVTSCMQDELSDDVYITLNDGSSYVATFDKDGLIEVKDINEKYCYSLKGKYRITQIDNKIKFNGATIAVDKDVKCCFSARSMIAVITSSNTLYIIDNGY